MKSNVLSVMSAADAVRQSVRQAGSLLPKLLYLAQARDVQADQYTDQLLALDFDPAELDKEFRRQHCKLFGAWLELTLEEQHAELLNYLHDLRHPQALLKWTQQWPERIVPPGTPSPERELFVSDFQIVTSLVACDLDRRSAVNFDASRPCNQNVASAPPLTNDAAALHIVNEAGRKGFMCRVFRKEQLADLYEKGKINIDRYLEVVNELRAAEALPAVHRFE